MTYTRTEKSKRIFLDYIWLKVLPFMLMTLIEEAESRDNSLEFMLRVTTFKHQIHIVKMSRKSVICDEICANSIHRMFVREDNNAANEPVSVSAD